MPLFEDTVFCSNCSFIIISNYSTNNLKEATFKFYRGIITRVICTSYRTVPNAVRQTYDEFLIFCKFV